MTLQMYRHKKTPSVVCSAKEATEDTVVEQGHNPNNCLVKVKKGEMIVSYPTCDWQKVIPKDRFLQNYETEEEYQAKKTKEEDL